MPTPYDLIVRGGEGVDHAGRGLADVGVIETPVHFRELGLEWNEDLKTGSGRTPFPGFETKAWPMATIVRGWMVIRDDEVVADGTGEPCRFVEALRAVG